MTEQLYRFRILKFRNGTVNPRWAEMHNRHCRVIARGKLNSAMVEFVDNGQREIISRNALRKVRP